MESTTRERCSFCGQTLTAAPEAPPARSQAADDVRSAAEATSAEPSGAASSAQTPAVDLQSSGAMSGGVPAARPAALRKPAPAILPKASERAGRLPVTPIPPVTPPTPHTAPPLSFDPPTPEPDRPRVSLSDPLAEHTIYMQGAAQSHSAPLLNSDAAGDSPPTAATPVTVADAGLARSAGAAPVAKPGAPLPAQKPVKKRKPLPDVVGEGAPTALLGRYTIALLLILLVAASLAYVGPAYQGIPLVLAQFVGGVLLPVMRLVPWADEDSDDVVLGVLFTIMFGPLVALLIYAILSAVRQSVNAGLMGCMIVAALSRLVVQLAAHDTPVAQLIPQTMPFEHLARFDAHLLVLLLRDWSGLIALAGWYFATVFRKLDE